MHIRYVVRRWMLRNRKRLVFACQIALLMVIVWFSPDAMDLVPPKYTSWLSR